ncbi:MAG: hypothetical protein V3U10_00520 [Bacteroidota bacterium]
MIKLLLLVVVLVAFTIFRQSQRWKNLLSDPKIRRGLLAGGGIIAWLIVVFLLFAVLEVGMVLRTFLSDRSLFSIYSFIGLAIILCTVALGIQFILAIDGLGTLRNFRSLFVSLLFFRFSELERKEVEIESEETEIEIIEGETPPSKEHDGEKKGHENHFGIS